MGNTTEGAPTFFPTSSNDLRYPEEPQFHRAVNDDMLVEVLQRIAVRLSYGLR